MKISGKRLMKHYGDHVDFDHKQKSIDKKKNTRLAKRKMKQERLNESDN